MQSEFDAEVAAEGQRLIRPKTLIGRGATYERTTSNRSSQHGWVDLGGGKWGWAGEGSARLLPLFHHAVSNYSYL